MKKLLSLSILASAMALSACGGSSDSSGGDSYSSTFSKTLANGNQYSCPTKASFDSCTSDSTCKVATCTATKIVTPIVDPVTTPACAVNGTFITGTKGKNCTFSLPNYNNGAVSIMECPATGGVKVGSTLAGGVINIYGYTLRCN